MAELPRESELPQTSAEAREAEDEIATRAEGIRLAARSEDGRVGELTPELFLDLWPLLREPVQRAYIVSIPGTKGKPYDSTGIKSVQVQIDRLNNVLTPLWWWFEDAYEEDGMLCTVTVHVGERPKMMNAPTPLATGAVSVGYGRIGQPLVSFTSKGGVNQGSTIGNIHKGSFTNAAKRAIAMLGPGHEVYVGEADLDPDVSRELAQAKAADTAEGKIGKAVAKRLVDAAWKAGEKDRLALAATRLAGVEIGDCSTKAKAQAALEGVLTFDQAEALDRWFVEQAEAKG